MNSSTSGTSSTSAVTASSSRRYSGLISGLDVDTLVKNLTLGTQKKIDKFAQKKQLASWRQTSYREVTTALQEFQDKYFKASSSSCISNTDFFQTTSISNSSSYLNVSGNSTNASKMVITGISQLAVQANFTSNHRVSNETVSSMAGVSDYYTKSNVASNSITINYGGTDYAVTLDSEFLLKDTDSAATNMNNVITELNHQIQNISDLKDKVSFTYDSVNDKVTLTSTDKNLYIKSGSSNLLSGLGLTTSTTGSTSATGTATQVKNFFNSSIGAGSELNFTINGNAATLELSSDVALTAANPAENVRILQAALNSAISGNSALKDKITASVTTDTDNNIKVSFSAASGTLAVTGGSKNMLNGLGLTVNTTETASVSGTANRDELVKTELGYALSGSTMAFSLDGVSKSITFNESERSQYSTVDGLKTYLQTKLNSVYGSGTVQVGLDSNSELTFKTANTSSTFSVSSCDNSGILGPEGVLHIYAGESNRLNTNKTLEDLASNWNTGLTAGTDGTYGITVNGKAFSFKASDTLAKVISTINSDSDANVTIAYSSTLDTFSVTADGGGATSSVNISDPTAATGNLATVLFGTKSTQAATAATLTYDFSSYTKDSLDNKTITLNGVTYEFTNDGSLSDVSHTMVDLRAVTSSAGIASAFSAAANLSGYKDTTNNSIVTFTATTAGAKTAPTASGDVTGTFVNGLNQDQDYTVTTGQNAELMVSFDGNKDNATLITRAENKFTLDEVNFELLKADSSGSTVNTDNPITFTQKSEVDDLYKKLSGFIDDYNAIIKLVSGKVNESTKTEGSTYAPLTDDQKSKMSETEITKWETYAKKGILQSDSLLTTLNDNLRGAMANAVTSVKSSLVAIGIDEGDYDDYGKLSITESDLKNALTNNVETVKNLFTNTDDGIAKRLTDILKANINTSIGDDGVLVQKAGISSRNYDTSVLGTEMTDYTSKIKDLKSELEDEQDRYYKKFTALETYMSTMNAQASLFTSSSSSS